MATLPGADVARGLGFITPDGATDLVRDGDDAITTNARAAAGAVLQDRARLAALELRERGPAGPDAAEVMATIGSRRFYAPMMKQYATGRCGVLWLGNSRSEGTGLSQLVQRAQNKLLEFLRAQYPVTGGDTGPGFLPAHYWTFYPLDREPTRSGTVVNIGYEGGLGTRSVQLNAGASITWAGLTTGASLDVHWTRHYSAAGTLEVVIDGTTVQTIACNGPAPAQSMSTTVTTTAGEHSIMLRCPDSSTAPVRVEGIVVRTAPTGWHLYDGSHSGFKVTNYTSGTSTWVGSTFAGNTADMHWQAVANLGDHIGLVVIALGANDMASYTPETWRTELAALANRVRAHCPRAGVLFMHDPERLQDTNARNTQLIDFQNAAREVWAREAFAGLWLESSVWQPLPGDTLAEQDPLGWLAPGDGVHPGVFGHAQTADAIARLFTPSGV